MIDYIIARWKYPFEFIHSTRVYENGCDGPSFYLSEKPAYGSPAFSRIVAHLNGTPYKKFDAMVCESCGEQIGILSSQLVRRRHWVPVTRRE